MAARILDGSAVANAIRAEVAPGIAAFTARAGRPPGLGIVLVGDDPASAIYVRGKLKSAGDAGLPTGDNAAPVGTAPRMNAPGPTASHRSPRLPRKGDRIRYG